MNKFKLIFYVLASIFLIYCVFNLDFNNLFWNTNYSSYTSILTTVLSILAVYKSKNKQAS